MRDQLDAAQQLARAVAGDDDERFILAFHSVMNAVDGLMSSGRRGADAPGAAEHVRSTLRGTAERHVSSGRRGLRAVGEPTGQPPGSIYADPVYIENAKSLIPNRSRVIGGTATSAFPDCVAVGSKTGWCCTGTLVAPNVVVSAGHCRGGCSSRVYIGTDVSAAGEIIDVRSAVKHPKYKPPSENHDLMVLILKQDATATPRPLATDKMLQAAKSVRVVGFGNTDVQSTQGYGQCRMVDVPLASNDPKYGSDPSTEFVAGAPFLDRDSCNGDSGGPAYVQSSRKWYLAGATSRATAVASPVRPCGDGGIYTRVSSFADWVRSVPGGHWA